MSDDRHILAVVGTDGAGKSTVSDLVAARLGDRGRRIERWDIVDNPAYPACRFMKPDIPDTRLCVSEMPNPARFLFLMWSIGIALTAAEVRRDVVTVLDGYWMKHAAAEIVYGLDRCWAEGVVAALPTADVVSYLRLEPEVALRRKAGDLVAYECGMDETCSDRAFLDHQARILAVLDQWADRYGWQVIDADAPLDTVVSSVVDAAPAALTAP